MRFTRIHFITSDRHPLSLIIMIILSSDIAAEKPRKKSHEPNSVSMWNNTWRMSITWLHKLAAPISDIIATFFFTATNASGIRVQPRPGKKHPIRGCLIISLLLSAKYPDMGYIVQACLPPVVL